VIAAGCGGSSKSAAPHGSTTIGHQATTSTVASPALRLQALSVHDLPRGWSLDPPSANTADPPACLKTVRHPAHSVARLNESFVAGASGIPAFNETLDAFKTVDDADAALAHAVTVLGGCRQMTWNLGGGALAGGVRALPLASVADESHAFQLRLTGTTRGLKITIDFDIVVARKGTTVMLTSLGDADIPDATLLTRLTARAVAKLGAGVA
jgi:hypothetical protein